ncbi:GntR family transcriptional regulator [Mycolicibacterium madagascariense]|uniref:GntR family transcriptional regulator n=1 Tax=Mycolicibacterium madagascariense TaxID=212765 RepID=A0A7I7XP52_9MYCO|nr:GntR family transcriptional regulator [Mycolicibacterium madagascariense]MCV7014003.1 GntR family transcriptional regulator [Mycolicibacterium madagascariense]BBZ31028.1 GntR family transcriptional regulator [Mycolicibacterium madagascariense]
MNAPVRARPRPRREQLSDEVAGHLRVRIMSGTLRPGTFIRLDETAAELGVSITPVREALRTLRGEGMVQLEPHRGHVVSPFTRGDIEDIFWLQAVIAGQLARSAAERVTDEEIDELERLAEIVADAIEHGSTADVADAEFAFHRTFNRASGRIKLAWFLLHAARYLPPHVYTADPVWGRQTVANRRELIAALRRRDVDTVVRLTDLQFTDGARRLTARLDELGLWT